MPLFRRRRIQPVDPEARSPELGVKFKDLLVLDQLMQAGADLKQPRHVLHYVYVKDAGAAADVRAAAFARGYAVELRAPDDPAGDWLVLSERHGVVTDPVTVRDTTDFFDQLAAAHGGDYDGWEASV